MLNLINMQSLIKLRETKCVPKIVVLKCVPKLIVLIVHSPRKSIVKSTSTICGQISSQLIDIMMTIVAKESVFAISTSVCSGPSLSIT